MKYDIKDDFGACFMQEIVNNRINDYLLSTLSIGSGLVLIIGKSGIGKSELLKKVSKQHKVRIISLNGKLAEIRLLDRATSIQEILEFFIKDEVEPIIFDNVELLFNPNLKINPISLFQSLAHTHKLIIAIPGLLKNQQLVYARPNNLEYKTYPLDKEIFCIDMNEIKKEREKNEI